LKLASNVVRRKSEEYRRIVHNRTPKSGQYHLDGRALTTTDGSKVSYSDANVFTERQLFDSPSVITDGTFCALCVLAGTVYLFYIEDNVIKYRTSDDDCATWSVATSTLSTTRAGSLDAVICDSQIYVFYTDESAGYSSIHYITSADSYASTHDVTASTDDRRYVSACVADDPDYYSEGALTGSQVVMLTFMHDDAIYLIMANETLNAWTTPVGIAYGSASDIAVGAEMNPPAGSSTYPVVTFLSGGKLYSTVGLITAQWTRPHYIGEAYKFCSILQDDEKIDVVVSDDRIEYLRYGQSLSVMSSTQQRITVAHDVPGYLNGLYNDEQYIIAYTVEGQIKIALSDAHEALSVDGKYNSLGEGYLHLWNMPGDVVDMEIELQHNHQIEVGESIAIYVRVINHIGGGRYDGVVTCSEPVNGDIAPANATTDRHGLARFVYTKTAVGADEITFSCEGIDKSIYLII